MSMLPDRYFSELKRETIKEEQAAINRLLKIQDARAELIIKNVFDRGIDKYEVPQRPGYERIFYEEMASVFFTLAMHGQHQIREEISLLQAEVVYMKEPYRFKKDKFGLATFDSVEYYKRHAIKIAGNFDKAQKRVIRRTLTDIAKEGLTRREASQRLAGTFQNFSRYRLENIARTESANMHSFGRLVGLYENHQMGLVSHMEFSATLDSRVTDCCEIRHGMVIPLDDHTAVAENTPPLHYMCRSILLPAFEPGGMLDDYYSKKSSIASERYKPLDGFGLKNLDGVLPGTQNKARLTFLDAPKAAKVVKKAPPKAKKAKKVAEPEPPAKPPAKASQQPAQKGAGHSESRVMSKKVQNKHIIPDDCENFDKRLKRRISAIQRDTGLSRQESKDIELALRRFTASDYPGIRAAQTGRGSIHDDIISHIINQTDASGRRLWPQFEKFGRDLEKYLERAPRFNSNVPLYRRLEISQEAIKKANFKVGGVIDMKGASSWTTKEDLLTIRNVHFISKNKSGASIKHLSEYVEEDEVLHSMFSRWRITKIVKDKDKYNNERLLIWVDELLTK